MHTRGTQVHAIKLTLFLGTLCLYQLAQATPTWRALHQRYGIDTDQHAFCFRSNSGEILGENIHAPVRLASVSKILTALWSIETLGNKFQYNTRFYFKDGHLHIKGSKDTIFSRRKLFYLVNQLNHYGIKSIKKLTFDDKTLVFANAEGYVGHVLEITASRTAQNLKDFLTTTEWNKLLPVYQNFYAQTPQELRDLFQLKSLPELELSIKSVEQKDLPDFSLEEAEITFSVLSSALEDYMKFMNIVSNNYIADQSFKNLGGEEAFNKYVKELIKINFPEVAQELKNGENTENLIKLYTGSGLNTKRGGSRVDNFATCALIINLIERFYHLSLELETKIQNMMAVVAVDNGTFKTRLRAPILENSIVAKTGTLYHTSSLVGLIHAQDGLVPFGIFHQITGGKTQVRQIQNEIVRTLVDQYGGPKPFSYTPHFFFPVSDEIF
jgi:D-alanyl-D-alanine carboxypeptidase/D-alanyl-D-alanine-endopeptidase (penicillin-binding protein 4)